LDYRREPNLPANTLILTATLYPGLVFAVGIFINFFIWGKHSSGAIPFTTMLSVGAMWFCISLPLVYIGYFFGYRKQPYEHPVRTNQIPRQVNTIGNCTVLVKSRVVAPDWIRIY
jgi:hypothetical protein